MNTESLKYVCRVTLFRAVLFRAVLFRATNLELYVFTLCIYSI